MAVVALDTPPGTAQITASTAILARVERCTGWPRSLLTPRNSHALVGLSPGSPYQRLTGRYPESNVIWENDLTGKFPDTILTSKTIIQDFKPLILVNEALTQQTLWGQKCHFLDGHGLGRFAIVDLSRARDDSPQNPG
jgi:hypothetical protein